MHIPDHVLDPATCVATGAAAAGAVGYAFHRVRRGPDVRTKSTIGLAAAGVFAVQMFNFPLAEGVSGHLLGGVVAAALLGPWAGILAMSCVLVVQCLVFQDGGVFALGANVLNMAVVGTGLGYFAFSWIRLRVPGPLGTWMGVVLASWLSVMLAAACCALEMSVGQPYTLTTALTSLLPTHAMIGLAEAVFAGMVTAIVLAPKWTLAHPSQQLAIKTGVVPMVLAVLLIAAMLSPVASSLPDGLEAALQELMPGGIPHAAAFTSPLAGYEMVGMMSGALSTSIAASIGVLITFVSGMLMVAYPRR